MTMEDGLAAGYKRADKHPKSTKYGRQNPISSSWNSEEQLLTWREQWAIVVNKYLDCEGFTERIDHRSFADQGITAQPTIHEGVIARALEKKGIVADRCEINRLIKADNAKLLESKTAKMTNAAESLEAIRDKMILLQYQIMFNDHQRDEIVAFLADTEPVMARHHAKQSELAVLKQKGKALQDEQKSLGLLHPIQVSKLSKEISLLKEEIEDVTGDRNMILTKLHCRDKKEADSLDRKMAKARNTRGAILSKQPKLHEQIRQSRDDYRQAAAQMVDDTIPVTNTIRMEHQQRVRTKLQETYGERFDLLLFEKCEDAVDTMIQDMSHPDHDRTSGNGYRMDAPDRRKRQDEAR